MSAHRMYVGRIQCDSPGCTDEHEDGVPCKAIRQMLRGFGWMCNSTGDFCPRHRPDLGAASSVKSGDTE